MIYYIVNSFAGSGKPDAAAPIIEEVTRARGQAYSMIYTKKPADSDRIGGLIDWPAAKAVVCVGGDGTVQEYTRMAVDGGKPFGVIPVGSANDLLYSLPARGTEASPPGKAPPGRKAPGGARARFRTFEEKVAFYTGKAIEGRTMPVDAVSVNGGRCFLNIGGTGMDIQVLMDALPLKKRFGGGAYFLSLIKNAASYKAEEMTLTIDGRAQTRKYSLLAFCNGSCYGGRMRIAPGALMDDGFLTICVVTRVPMLKMMAIFPLVKPGWHTGFREVSFINAKTAKLEFEGVKTINFDGNLWEYESPVEFTLLEGAIDFIV